MTRPKLIAADAYLRRPSAGLVPHQMVYLQRISFACDIIEDAIARLHTLAESIRTEAAKMGISAEESLRDGGGNVHFVMSVTSVFDDDKAVQ